MTAEQQARAILDECGVDGAWNKSSGDVVTLANLVADRDALLAAVRAMSMDGECWCAGTVGPGTDHSPMCYTVRRLVQRCSSNVLR
jgi:hypothetical protein